MINPKNLPKPITSVIELKNLNVKEELCSHCGKYKNIDEFETAHGHLLEHNNCFNYFSLFMVCKKCYIKGKR